MAEMPRTFTASTEVALACPQQIMLRLCAHFREFGDVTVNGACSRIDTGFGIAGVEACERCLKIVAEGKDQVALAYIKLALAEHLLNFAGDEAPQIVWQGDGAAGQPLPYFREMRVARAVNVTPRMRRVTLVGEDIRRFAEGGMHVRLLFPKHKADRPSWPVTGQDGRPLWPQGEDRPDVRIYTIRRIDVERGEVDIDFVLHEGASMPGADFATNAKPGDLVGMTGPGGGSVGQADWYLLAGDETALPAISRILEGLPASAKAVVRIEVTDASAEQLLTSAASLDLRWLHRSSAITDGEDQLFDAVRSVEWPQNGEEVFLWAGCEHASFRSIRAFARKEKALRREQHLVVSYWRRGFQGDSPQRTEQ